jgi:excisionase family DNA binding protein
MINYQEKNMFKVYFTNFDQESDQEFKTIFDAITFAKDSGFECSLSLARALMPVASYSPISGVVKWHISQPLTTSDAAHMLGVTVTRVHQFIRDGRLKSTKFGKAHQISISDLEEFARIPRLSGVTIKK